MIAKNDSSLFYLCGLIEHMGRRMKLRRSEVVESLGDGLLDRIYRYADVLHSDSIDHVDEEYCSLAGIAEGDYDNVGACKYEVPDYWTIASVYSRLIEDVAPAGAESPLPTLREVYASWVSDAISNYNADFFYQPRSYIAACYEAGEVLE